MTVERGRAYLGAGADLVFVPLLVDPDVVRRVADGLGGPLSLMALPGAPAAEAAVRRRCQPRQPRAHGDAGDAGRASRFGARGKRDGTLDRDRADVLRQPRSVRAVRAEAPRRTGVRAHVAAWPPEARRGS